MGETCRDKVAAIPANLDTEIPFRPIRVVVHTVLD